jgi:signal peptidase I
MSGRTRLALLAGVLVALVGARAFVAEPLRIPSDSMAPTILHGDHVLSDRLTYRFRDPERGELAVFSSPDTGELTLKRVVGVGGDRIEVRDGVLLVNGERQREPFVDRDVVDGVFFGPVRVPAGTVFVMGDARDNSRDSRAFGPVPVDDVEGRAILRLWPLSRAGTL